MAVFIWYPVKRDLSSVRYCKAVAYTSVAFKKVPEQRTAMFIWSCCIEIFLYTTHKEFILLYVFHVLYTYL